ncbi:MAG TPA: hypothetical protein VL854_04590 [Nitrososphaeraceae archaeon]|nr:hypothetical protein [Nitrososphaeraceae archaeon]
MKKQKKGPSGVSSTTVIRMIFVPLISIIMMTLAITGFGIDQNSSAQSQGSDNATNITSNNNTNLGSNDSSANTTAPTTITLPLSKGFVDGKVAYFIATDASSEQIVSSVSNTTSFKVNYAPSLADTPQSSRQQGYVFINGLKGEGPLGSQMSVASVLPSDEGYSPLFEINYVKWNSNATKDIRILQSVDEIMAAEKGGELTITKSNIVINSPAISMDSLP